MRLLVLFALLSIPAAAAAQPAAPREPLVAQVKRSIDRGVQYLRQTQRPDGGWEIHIVTEGGQTGLAVLALLNSGVGPNDPAVKRGLDYLRRLKSDQTYTRALQAMVLAEANLPEDRALLKDHVDWLLNARILDGNRLHGWSYSDRNRSLGGNDGSNTQYALLGLWAGKQAGIDIRTEVWEGIRKHYLDDQDRTGWWPYARNNQLAPSGPSLTMTTAGVSGLLIAGMELNAGREKLDGPVGPAGNCGLYEENRGLERGFSWISRNFSIHLSRPARTFYHLYGLERAGRLSGQRFFGEYDWYREGARELVRMQKQDGSWWIDETLGWDKWPVVSTSLSLLFLSKGRTPVLMSKLVHGSWPRQELDLDWNNDRNDLRHLVAHASKELFRRQPLAWQTIDLMQAARPGGDRAVLTEEDLQAITSDLLQSPILYLTGHLSPRDRLTATEKELLKRYLENGGFLFAEACCGRPEFDRGFKDLVAEIWPDQELELLPAEHPVWQNPHVIPPGQPYPLYGLSQGCKTVLIYSPQDLSCRWETGKPEEPHTVQAFRLGLNVIAYATGMQPPQPRLTQMAVASSKDDPPKVPRGYLKVAQLKHSGDWHPAPRAMRNLLDHLNKHAGLDVALKSENRSFNDKALIDFKFLYMHGRGEFRFDKDELENLRFNLKTGGLLLADACCGKEAFDKTFRELVKALFPETKLERVPQDDPLFSRELGGEALTEATIRLRTQVGQPFRNEAPFLEGIKHEGRWIVLYSKYDIGCALERHQAPDCRGYDPASAEKIGRAVVLYALRP